MDQGASPEAIGTALVEKGVDPADAFALVERFFEHDKKTRIRELAQPLVEKKLAREDIEQELLSSGFDQPMVAAVVKELIEARDRELQEESDDVGPIYRILGIGVFLLGVALYVGNDTRWFPTFSFAGYVTMGIGAAVFVVGQRLGRGS